MLNGGGGDVNEVGEVHVCVSVRLCAFVCTGEGVWCKEMGEEEKYNR